VIEADVSCVLYRFESFIDAEVQQRAVEYFALSRKGMSMMDILAEMPKFPEREV
jgi:AP-2 complex subunit alpha